MGFLFLPYSFPHSTVLNPFPRKGICDPNGGAVYGCTGSRDSTCRYAIQTCSRSCANEVLIPAQVRSAPKVEESPSDRRSLSSENAIWRQGEEQYASTLN